MATLTDKGIAVFAFAAYHQMTSGEPVKQVVRSDGKGHEADPEAVGELEAAGLATTDGSWITFTDAGLQRLEATSAALRAAS